jgi:hypothetical protein
MNLMDFDSAFFILLCEGIWGSVSLLAVKIILPEKNGFGMIDLGRMQVYKKTGKQVIQNLFTCPDV